MYEILAPHCASIRWEQESLVRSGVAICSYDAICQLLNGFMNEESSFTLVACQIFGNEIH
jgi:hypothetical protein